MSSRQPIQSGAAPRPVNASMSGADWLLLLLLSSFWSWTYLFNRVALDDVPVLTIVLARCGIAAIALVIFLHAVGQRLPARLGAWGAFALLGLINNAVPFSLIVAGQIWVTTGATAILLGTTPLFSVVLAHFLTSDERMTPARVLGVLVGLAGLVILVGPEALRLGYGFLGQVLILLAALLYTLAAIYGRSLRAFNPLVLATGQLVCSSLMMIPLAFAVDRPWTLSPGLPAIGSLLAIALIGTAVAYIVYFRLLASAGPTNMLLVTFLVPVGALVIGVLVLDEAVTLPMIAGMGLIFAGLAVIDGRLLRWVRSAAASRE